MKKAFILLLLIVLSSSAYSAGQKFRTGVFLHQTIGARIWGPNDGSTTVPIQVYLFNNSHGFTDTDSFKLTETIFPADEDNNEWYRWREIFENTRSTADIRPYIDANKIIIIKTNYLSSEMTSWGSADDTLDPTIKSVYNYKWHWRRIIEIMRTYSDKYFVIWTNAPRAISPDSQALFSHYFCKWAKDTLATGKDPIMTKFPINVYVFDYFHKLTDANSNWKLKPIYSANDNPNYPDSAATALVAPALVQESFNAILTFENYFNPEMISVPILVSPADTAKNVAKNAILKWRKIQYATRYSVQIALDSAFTSIIESDNSVTDTFYVSSNLYYDSKYFWRVKSFNYGGNSNWSAPRSFRTQIAPPGVPVLLQPSDKQINTPVNMYFSWLMSAPAAEKYRLQIAKNSNFSLMVVDSQNITVNSVLILNKLDSTTTYYWRVKGINVGGESEWSTVWSFTTVSAIPSNITLIEPTNNSIDVHLNPTFMWTKSARASNYIFQLATDNVFSNLVNADSTVTDTVHSVTPNLLYDMTYYWRVRAVNSTGRSNWSQVWAFHTIKDVPAIPIVIFPSNGDVNVPLKPLLNWHKSARAERYTLQLAHDAGFTNNIYDNVVVLDTFYMGNVELQRNQVYWWHVKALNYAGESEFSASASFTTLVMPPSESYTLSPKQGDTSVPVYTTFLWNRTPAADSYNLQVAKDYSFYILVVNKTNISDTTFSLSNPLDLLTEFFWRVKGVNAGGEGEWSNYISFTTEAVSAVEDGLIADDISVSPNPFNNAINIKIKLSEPELVLGSLYSINGQNIGKIISQWFEAGEQNIKINLSSFSGLSENNMMILKLKIGNKTRTIKLIRN